MTLDLLQRATIGILVRPEPIRRDYFDLGEVVEVRESPIHGKGLFAARNLAPGDTLLRMDLGLFSNKERHPWNARDRNILPHYVNHSCGPNAALVFEPRLHRMRIVAITFIPFGAEVTIDYALTEIGGATILCRCGSSHCRGRFPVNRPE